MKIIEAEEEHIDQIVALWVELMDHHHELNPYHYRRPGAEKNWEVYLRKNMDSDDGKVLVTIENGSAIGFIIANIKEAPPIFSIDRFGFISDMLVNSEHRGKGIGSKMLAEIKDWFLSRDVHRVELRVEPRNSQGIGFWSGQGFNEHVRTLYLDI